MKVVKTTYFRVTKSPLHVADAFELQQRRTIVETLEDFRKDVNELNLKNLELGDSITFEVLNMPEAEFNALKPFSVVL